VVVSVQVGKGADSAQTTDCNSHGRQRCRPPGPAPGFIRKTIGIQALFDVLTVLLPVQLASKDLTKAAWRKHLEPAARINFGDRLFHASGSGRTLVKKALLLAMGRLPLSEIDERLKVDFQRALGR
jgi:hypothetical protein